MGRVSATVKGDESLGKCKKLSRYLHHIGQGVESGPLPYSSFNIKEVLTMLYDDVNTWKDYKGKKELLKHLAGEPLTLKQAVVAQCYSCNAGYFDGRIDCQTPQCSLYGFMPYRKIKVKRERSEKQMKSDRKAGLRLAKSKLQS